MKARNKKKKEQYRYFVHSERLTANVFKNYVGVGQTKSFVIKDNGACVWHEVRFSLAEALRYCQSGDWREVSEAELPLL